MWYQFFKYTLFAPGTRLVCRPWVVGEERTYRLMAVPSWRATTWGCSIR